MSLVNRRDVGEMLSADQPQWAAAPESGLHTIIVAAEKIINLSVGSFQAAAAPQEICHAVVETAPAVAAEQAA